MPHLLVSIERAGRSNIDAFYKKMSKMQYRTKKTRLNQARRLAGFYYIFITCLNVFEILKAYF